MVTSETRVDRLRREVRRKPELCIERAVLFTESYKETEGQPEVIRRAKSLEKLLSGMPIHIAEGELLVGNATSKRVAGPMLPEVTWKWYLEEMETLSLREQDSFQPMSEEDKAMAREVLTYWRGKSVFDRWVCALPDEFKRLKDKSWAPGGANPYMGIHLAHCCPGFDIVTRDGLNKVIEKIDNVKSNLDLTRIDDFNSSLFLDAARIAVNAVISFAHRYADLARKMATEEADSQRKRELKKMADTCKWVPANPARTFHEAMQAMWFTYIATMLEGWGPGLGFGRLDQYMYPFYKKDLENNVLTREEARELIAMFYIKINEMVMPFSDKATTQGNGQLTLSGITLGGIDKNGYNGVNDLSYIFLEAEEDVRLQEDLTVRVHSSTPDAFLMKACDIAFKMKGKVKFVSDETIIKQLLKDGKPITFARDYAVTGCFIRTVPGISFDPGGDFINLPMMLELALNNGVSRLTGEQLGPKTGDPRKFKTYEEVWDAYTRHVEYLTRNVVTANNLNRQLFARYLPAPLQSALYGACIEKGIDITEGGTNPYSTLGMWVTGIPNVGDSLATLKKLVFDDKKMSMKQLLDALDRNFEGEDRILHLINIAPKFGNDIDSVDSIVNDVVVNISDEFAGYEGFGGFRYTAAGGSVIANIPLGKAVGALPDGRLAGLPLSDGGISPYRGRNTSGPTATMRSVAKLDLIKTSGGNVLNMRFNPDSLSGESKMRKFAFMIRKFCETGGDLVQFNIVDTATLIDAQQHPENYRDLLVRVATYSAYFVDLPVEQQNDIIARTEFGEV
jgi:pyruvate formate-lyase/glycerol dehydratase family glycyl radical enzyme